MQTYLHNDRAYGVDNDDVLFPVGQHYCCDFHNHHYGTQFTFDDLKDFNLAKQWNVPPYIVWERERHFYNTKFYTEMKPFDDAHPALDFLSHRAPTHLITGRGTDVEHHTKYMLDKHFKPYHFEKIHHTGPHAFGFESTPKWKVCKEHGITTLFDDYHASLIQAAVNNINGILFTKPWNEHITDLPNNIYRVRNWEEAISTVIKHNL